MTERVRRAGQVSWAVVGIAAMLGVIGLVAWTVRVIFPPLVLAGAIVFLLNPVVTVLQRRGMPRAAGAGIAYLGVVALLGLGVVVVYPVAANQAEQLSADWPHIQSRIERWVDDRAEDSRGTFVEFTRDDVEDAVSNNSGTFEDQLKRVRKLGSQVLHALLVLVLAPIIAFYLLVDVPHLRRVSESLIPDGARVEVLTMAHRINRAVGGFFRGQLLIALVVGVLCSALLAAIGLKFWFLVGMIAGLFNVIPLIGPWIGGIPGITIALTTGSPVKALLVVAILAGVQQVDNHFITPQVMQRAVHLHPAAVILALLAGGSLGGFFGLLLAVPTAATLKIIASHVWRVHVLGEPVASTVEGAESPPEGADQRHAVPPDGSGGDGPVPVQPEPGGPVQDVATRPENQGAPTGDPEAAEAPAGSAGGRAR